MVAQCTTTLLGIWLMAAPAALMYTGVAESVDRTVGPIVATFAAVAAAECTRELRLANVPLGVFLMVAPIAFAYPTDAMLNSTVTGAAITALACVRGPIRSRFGGGWSVLWRGSTGRHD